MNNILYNDKKKARIIYLGYDVKLSKKEYKIYCCIEENSDNYISAEKIIDICYPDKKPQKGNIVTHICHINEKAERISQRPLIVSKYGVGYKITDRP